MNSYCSAFLSIVVDVGGTLETRLRKLCLKHAFTPRVNSSQTQVCCEEPEVSWKKWIQESKLLLVPEIQHDFPDLPARLGILIHQAVDLELLTAVTRGRRRASRRGIPSRNSPARTNSENA